jgi:hypothetical protein
MAAQLGVEEISRQITVVSQRAESAIVNALKASEAVPGRAALN